MSEILEAIEAAVRNTKDLANDPEAPKPRKVPKLLILSHLAASAAVSSPWLLLFGGGLLFFDFGEAAAFYAVWWFGRTCYRAGFTVATDRMLEFATDNKAWFVRHVLKDLTAESSREAAARHSEPHAQ